MVPLPGLASGHDAGPVRRRTEPNDPLGGSRLSPAVEGVLARRRGRGQPLQADIAQTMGEAMGADLGNVRIHTGDEPAELARAVQATAFTQGTDIYFGAGTYAPQTLTGQRLLAHELAHTVQQSPHGGLGAGPIIGRAADPAEAEADRVADGVLRVLQRQTSRQLGLPTSAPPGGGTAPLWQLRRERRVDASSVDANETGTGPLRVREDVLQHLRRATLDRSNDVVPATAIATAPAAGGDGGALGRLRRHAERRVAAGSDPERIAPRPAPRRPAAPDTTIRRFVIKATDESGTVKLVDGNLDTADFDTFRSRVDSIAMEKPRNPIATLAWLALRLRLNQSANDPGAAKALEYVQFVRDEKIAELGKHVVELVQLPQFEALVRDLEIDDQLLGLLAKQARSTADRFREAIGRATATVGADGNRLPIERLELMTDLCRTAIATVADESMALLRELALAPVQPVAVMTGGSFARKEVFPASDLDFGVVGSPDEAPAVMRLLLLMDAKVNIARRLLASDLGLPAEKAHNVAFEPDNGPFLTNPPSPKKVAETGVATQNTVADASLLMTGVGTHEGQQSVFNEFLVARGAKTNPQQTFEEVRARLEEFHPFNDVHGKVDVKNPLMRLITLTMRDLATYFEVGGSSTVERIDALERAMVLDPGLAAGLRDAFNVLVGLRITLHTEHQVEHDTLVTQAEVGEHLLTQQEFKDLTRANMILTGYHDALSAFVKGDPNPLAGRSVKEKPKQEPETKKGSSGGLFGNWW